jgi:Fic family protein
MPRTTGRYENTSAGGERVAAFVPHPLPPREPPLERASIEDLLGRAGSAVSRLELAGAMVPSVDWFVYSFVRKEAVLSSQIEGTQATLVDLLVYEASEKAPRTAASGVQEVCNYLQALKYARDQIRTKKGLPLSLRLLNEAHRILMRGVRGSATQPGEFRRSQNWIGGTRPGNAIYVPPPPSRLGELLDALEKYLHADDDLPPLVRMGLLHVQFETIHPYLDGNGRIGRLLITLLLEHWGLLTRPLLYLSLFFKSHRAEYYRRLDAVRTEGDFEAWLRFFLEGVATVAGEASATIQDLFAIVSADRTRVLAARSVSVASLRLFEELPEHPIVSIGRVRRLLKTTKPTAAKAVGTLVNLGVLAETTRQKRDRAFAYTAYLDRLRIGTELEGPSR